MHRCGTLAITLQSLVIAEVTWLILVNLKIQMPI